MSGTMAEDLNPTQARNELSSVQSKLMGMPEGPEKESLLKREAELEEYMKVRFIL